MKMPAQSTALCTHGAPGRLAQEHAVVGHAGAAVQLQLQLLTAVLAARHCSKVKYAMHKHVLLTVCYPIGALGPHARTRVAAQVDNLARVVLTRLPTSVGAHAQLQAQHVAVTYRRARWTVYYPLSLPGKIVLLLVALARIRGLAPWCVKQVMVERHVTRRLHKHSRVTMALVLCTAQPLRSVLGHCVL